METFEQDWERESNPEAESAVRKVREMDDGELARSAGVIAKAFADEGKFYHAAETILEIVRRWNSVTIANDKIIASVAKQFG